MLPKFSLNTAGLDLPAPLSRRPKLDVFNASGLKNVMWTKQPANKSAIERAVALSIKDPTFSFVIDDPIVFDWIEQAAAAENAKLKVLISVDAGLSRQGIENGQPSLALAQKIASSKQMQFEGVMAYAGIAAHTHGFEARRAQSAKDMALAPKRPWVCSRNPDCR